MTKEKILSVAGWVVGVSALSGLAISTVLASGVSNFNWRNAEKETGKEIANKVWEEKKASGELVPLDEEKPLGAVVDPNNLPALLCQSDGCTFNATGSFIDASTTIVSVIPPFLQATSTSDTTSVVVFTDDGGKKYTAATTTVDIIRLNVTGAATSSFQLACGATSTRQGGGLTVGASYRIQAVSTTQVLPGDSIPTSSLFSVENNLTPANGGMINVGTVPKIAIGPGAPYVTCVVAAVDNLAFTNANNTFDGKFLVRFMKTRF